MKDRKFSWLQLSDLHINESALFNLQKSEFQELTKIDGFISPEFLVVSGDFRNIKDPASFTRARTFLENTILPAFNINKKNVYFVPGNHDVRIADDDELKRIKNIVRTIKKGYEIESGDINFLVSRFNAYEDFVKSFYKGSGVCDGRIKEPARVLRFPIDGLFNIILINTALASCNDKAGKNCEIVDLQSLSELIESDNGLPSFVVAHHPIANIIENQQSTLSHILQKLHVKAWLCGDTHKISADSSMSRTYLDEDDIPILVSGKTPIQAGDKYSDNNLTLFTYSNQTVTVHVYRYSKGETNAPGFHKASDYYGKYDKPLEIKLGNKNDCKTASSRPYQYKTFINAYKTKLKNELILPWLHGNHLAFDAIFKYLYITPKLTSKKKRISNFSYRKLTNECLNQNIVITGDAGVGKSTLLKYLFLFFQPLKKCQFLYINANELFENNAKASEVSSDNIELYYKYIRDIIKGEKSGNKKIILLDGIDEVFAEDLSLLEDLLSSTSRLSNVYVWLGWRSDHYDSNKTELIDHCIDDVIYVKDWDIKTAKRYVSNYSKRVDNMRINEVYLNSLLESENILAFSTNPFQLTLLVYLIQNNIETQIDLSSISLFDLYNNFIDIWIDKEIKTHKLKVDKTKILKKLESYAEIIYYSNNECEIIEKKSVIRDLFHYNTFNQAYAFCHRSLSAFFVATKMLEAMQDWADELALCLAKPMNDDVTRFIKSAVSHYEDERIRQIQARLVALYNGILTLPKYYEGLIEGSIAGILSVKNGIVYLLTRLKPVSELSADFIREIASKETDIKMKVTIAYGAAALGLQDIALEYAKEFYDNDSELALATRSFSLVYYRDVPETNLYDYTDDGLSKWDNSRKVRLQNLGSKTPKLKNFRILDIPLLHSFYQSRDWKDVNLKDYNIIKNCRIEVDYYDEGVFEFLKEKTAEFRKEFRDHIPRNIIKGNRKQ